MQNVFHLVSDPGHSWLKVPLTELNRLNIPVSSLTNYSYHRNGMAYLEEDQDMGVFTQAREAAGQPYTTKVFTRVRTSKIRNYRPLLEDLGVSPTS